MPPNTRSHIPTKKVNVILNTKSRPRFMRKLPLELRDMVYSYLLVPRTIEVKFISKKEAEAYAKATKAAHSSYNNAITAPLKYVYPDDDPIDDKSNNAICRPDPMKARTPTHVQTFRYVNTSGNQLVLHAISHETRQFALKRYTHIFKTRSNPTGLLINFDLDILAFTTQMNTLQNELKYKFAERKSFQADIARIQNMAIVFFCHYKELRKVHRGTAANARTFVTCFPGLKKVFVSLPLEHFDHCRFCNGNRGEVADPEEESYMNHANSHIDNADNHFNELKQKLKDAGTQWVAPELIYNTHCLKQRWTLQLGDPKKESKKSS